MNVESEEYTIQEELEDTMLALAAVERLNRKLAAKVKVQRDLIAHQDEVMHKFEVAYEYHLWSGDYKKLGMVTQDILRENRKVTR